MNTSSDSNIEYINKAHTEFLKRATSKSERKNTLDSRLYIAEEKTSEFEDIVTEMIQNETDKILGHNSKSVSEG